MGALAVRNDDEDLMDRFQQGDNTAFDELDNRHRERLTRLAFFRLPRCMHLHARCTAEKRLDRAHARYLSAIKALASVQKLLRPSPSVFDLLRRPVPEAPGPWAARGQ